MDVYASLVIDAGGVKLLGTGRNCRIARNDFCDGAAIRLNAEGERRDVEQEHSFHALIEDVGLNGGAERDDFVRIQFDMRLATEEFLHGAADQRGALGTADQDYFVHGSGLELGVGKGLVDGAHGAVNYGVNEGIESAASEFVGKQVAIRQWKTKSGCFGLGELMLDVDEGFTKLLGNLSVGRKIDFSVLKDQFVDKCLEQIVDVVATEVRVAIGRKNLEDIAVSGGDKLENGNIEGPAAEIVDSDFAALLLVQAVGERGRSRFVDKAKNFEAGDFAGVLGGLALGIIEIRRDGDDGAIDKFAEIGLGPVFQFAEDESGNLRRVKDFVTQQHADDVLARWIDTERKQLKFILDIGGTAAH